MIDPPLLRLSILGQTSAQVERPSNVHGISVIGIAGFAGVGKTALAEMIQYELETSGHRVSRIMPFAEPVKRIAREMGWDGEKDERGRQLLQRLGTDCGRAYDYDVWVKLWRSAVTDRLQYNGGIIIADDVRFFNEAIAVKAMGGLMIRVDRPGFPQGPKRPWWKFWCAWSAPHASERGLPEEYCDIRMMNDGDLDDLRWFAGQIVRMIP